MAGQEAISGVNGPLSRSLEMISIFAEAVINHGQPWLHDPKAVPIPWRKVTLPAKLSIGVIRHDGVVKPHPPVERAIEMVIKALKKAGHEVIDFEPYNHAKGVGYLLVRHDHQFSTWTYLTRKGVSCAPQKCFGADGATSIRKLIEASGEDWPLGLKAFQFGERFHLSTYDMWQVQNNKRTYVKEYLDHWMASRKQTSTGREVDFLLCPTIPYASCPHDSYDTTYVGYTGIWNG